MSDRLGVDPDWPAAVISYESGWIPSNKNPTSSASGLIQFTEDTAKSLQTTTAALRAMTIAEQLPYVERYFRPYSGRMKTLSSVYAAVFGPGANGANVVAPDATVIYRSPSQNYSQNTILDYGRKGYITKEDLARAAQSKLDAAGGVRIEVDLDAPPPIDVADTSNVPLVLLAAAGGWLLADWYTNKYGLALPGKLAGR